MYEDLIENIEAYKLRCEDDDAMPNVDDVIVIIMQAEPSILDKPDSEGWWWFDDNKTITAYEVKKINCSVCYWGFDKPSPIHCGTMNWLPIEELKGKWVKAIIPEPKWSPAKIDRSEPEHIVVTKDTAESEG